LNRREEQNDHTQHRPFAVREVCPMVNRRPHQQTHPRDSKQRAGPAALVQPLSIGKHRFHQRDHDRDRRYHQRCKARRYHLLCPGERRVIERHKHHADQHQFPKLALRHTQTFARKQRKTSNHDGRCNAPRSRYYRRRQVLSGDMNSGVRRAPEHIYRP
jgi:hypothetical protein